jgi:hypothetical protein
MSLANDTPFFDTQMIHMPPFPGLSFIISKLSFYYYCCDRTIWSVIDICSLGQLGIKRWIPSRHCESWSATTIQQFETSEP